MFNEFKSRAIIVVGALMLALFGRQRFYRLTQEKCGLRSKFASYFCSGHVRRLIHDYDVQIEGRDKDRISQAALTLYGDDSLMGYGDAEFQKADGKPLLEQQRGLIIPLVCTEIEAFIAKNKTMPRVLEVGVANGDVLAYLAQKYPEIPFIGVDLSVKNAERKYQLPNLTLVKGYSLDMFTEQPDVMKADIVFGTSTFCAMVPNEFRRHVEQFSANGTTSVIFSDPVTCGLRHANDDRDVSLHMSHYMWWHNYAGYLRKGGYAIAHWQQRTFVYSWNPRAQVILCAGRKP